MTGRPQHTVTPTVHSACSLPLPRRPSLQHRRLILCLSKHKSAARPRENLTFFILGECRVDVDFLSLLALDTPRILLHTELRKRYVPEQSHAFDCGAATLPSLKSAHAEMDFKSTPDAVTDRCNITSRSLTLTFSPFHSASLPETIDYPYRLRIVPAYGEKRREKKS